MPASHPCSARRMKGLGRKRLFPQRAGPPGGGDGEPAASGVAAPSACDPVHDPAGTWRPPPGTAHLRRDRRRRPTRASGRTGWCSPLHRRTGVPHPSPRRRGPAHLVHRARRPSRPSAGTGRPCTGRPSVGATGVALPWLTPHLPLGPASEAWGSRGRDPPDLEREWDFGRVGSGGRTSLPNPEDEINTSAQRGAQRSLPATFGRLAPWLSVRKRHSGQPSEAR